MYRRMNSKASESEPYIRKIGIRMILLGWIVLIGLLAVLFNGVLEDQYNPNRTVDTAQHAGLRTVSLRQDKMGHYVVGGKINAHAVEFLVDTGATTISVPQHIADRLSLKKGPSRLYSTANGSIRIRETVLDAVQIGNITVHNVRAGINPHTPDNKVLLGMSFLKNLELQQKDGILTLTQHR